MIKNLIKVQGAENQWLQINIKIFSKIICKFNFLLYLCIGLNDEGSPHSLLVISFSVINYVVSRVVAREGHNSFLSL